jgi:hypothetical protein
VMTRRCRPVLRLIDFGSLRSDRVREQNKYRRIAYQFCSTEGFRIVVKFAIANGNCLGQ